MSGAGTSVVLIEFALSGGFRALPTTPFLRGALAQRGIPSRWLRFVVVPTLDDSDAPPGVCLPAEDLDTLRQVCRQARPSAVLFDAPPSPAVVAAVRVGGRRPRLAIVDSVTRHPPEGRPGADGIRRLGPGVAELLAWIDGGGARPADPDMSGTPDFGFEEANAAARRATPSVMLLSGRSCDWTGPLADSRFFSSRPEEGCPERWGCTFCVGPSIWDPAFGDLDRSPFETLVQRQIDGLVRTFPRTARRPEVRLLGARFGTRTVEFARLVAASAWIPSTFVLECRADRLADRIDAFRQAAECLATAGHRLQLGVVGIESFSARQLDRFHKGYPPRVNLAALRILRALVQDRSSPLELRPDSGLSTILLDPWASPSDPAVTLAVVRRLNLVPLCRKILGSRLRLHPGLPLAASAQADGLLLDRYDDPFLDTARRTLYPEELPWRFADPRMDSLGRLVARLSDGPGIPDDPLVAALQDWGRAEGIDALEQAARLCQAAEAPLPLPPVELLERARGLRPAGLPCEWIPSPRPSPEGLAVRHAVEYAFFAAGLKPVMKLEEPHPEGPLAARIAEEQARWPGATIRVEVPRWADGAAIELFVGRDESQVDDTRTLARFLDASGDSKERRRAAGAFGRRMGYPACCCRAFLAGAHVTSSGFEMLRLDRLLQGAPENGDRHRFPPFFHLLATHVPCSTACEATGDLLRRLVRSAAAGEWLDRWAATWAVDPGDDWRGWGDLPVVHLLDRPGQFLLMRFTETARDATRERYRYTPVAASTADRRGARFLAGDELEVDEGVVRILASGRETAMFPLDAFLACGPRVSFPEFWAEWVAVSRDPFPELSGPAAEDPGRPFRLALVARLAGLLDGTRRDSVVGATGFRLDRIDEFPSRTGWGRVVVVVLRGGERLAIHVEPRLPGVPAFLETRRFRISHDAGTPVDSAGKRAVIEGLARGIDAFEADGGLPDLPA